MKALPLYTAVITINSHKHATKACPAMPPKDF